MSNQGRQGDRAISTPPEPAIDEAYWAALIQEEETTPSEAPQPRTEDWDSFDLNPLPYETTAPLETHSLTRASDWETIRNIMESDTTLDLPVIGSNRGGLLVQWESLRGFVPASQLVDFIASNDEYLRRHELAQYVGKQLFLRVIELDEIRNRLILSERAAQVDPGTRAGTLDTLRSGDMCQGIVTNVCNFGVFVDLGGVEGLIHISELSWGRVGHPKDVLQRGERVAIHIMEVDKGQGRVALSLKRLHPDPWETVGQRFHIGQIVEGVITNVVDFGAFACIEEGLEGLVHISELAEGHFLHPRNVVQEGDTVRARILNIDGPARRLGLSLRDVSLVE